MIKCLTLWMQAKGIVLNEKGQGMVEYGLILALIAVAVAASLTGVAENLKTEFSNIASKLSAN